MVSDGNGWVEDVMEDIARPGGGGRREGPVFTARHADKYWCSVSSPQRAKPDSDRVIFAYPDGKKL